MACQPHCGEMGLTTLPYLPCLPAGGHHMLPNLSGSSLCWLSQVQGSSSREYGVRGTSKGSGRNKAFFAPASSDTTKVAASPNLEGRSRTPSSYERIISWLPFFSNAPQAAFDRFALVMSSQAACFPLGDNRV